MGVTSTKADTVLGHCLMRAALATGIRSDRSVATTFAVIRATPRASRVAALIAMWANALIDLDVDSLGAEAYAEWAAESRRTVYRRLADFRELWPEYDTPNELAAMLAVEARKNESRKADPMTVVEVAI